MGYLNAANDAASGARNFARGYDDEEWLDGTGPMSAGNDEPKASSRVTVTDVRIPFRRLMQVAFEITAAALVAAVGVGVLVGFAYYYVLALLN